MSHSYSNNYVHAVYSTKDRRDLISTEFEKRLYSFMASTAVGHKIPLLAAGGMADHSHLLFLLPATISLASAINIFKTNSSRFLHERGLVFQWQQGYAAFSVSISQLDQVTAYILNQREHHKKMTFEEEFLVLLKKAGVSYDPNMCWDEWSAAPTALGIRIFDVPALPGWADVWRTALRALWTR